MVLPQTPDIRPSRGHGGGPQASYHEGSPRVFYLKQLVYSLCQIWVVATLHDKRWKECQGIKIPAICKHKTIRRGKILVLQESAFLQQTRHLLVLTLPRFSLQAEVPEIITQIPPIFERTQRVLNE